MLPTLKKFSMLLPMFLIVLGGCNKTSSIADAYFDQGQNIDYRGIRTEDRKNKVRQELDQ